MTIIITYRRLFMSAEKIIHITICAVVIILLPFVGSGICEPETNASAPTPAQIRDLRNLPSSENILKIISALKSSDVRVREEALLVLQNFTRRHRE